MSTYDRAIAIAAKLEAAGVPVATVDPRSATPPCVLIVPPAVVYDTACSGSADWRLYALAPGTPNADAWRALDDLEAAVVGVCPVERRDYVAYSLSPDNPALPAYRLLFTESVEVET